MDKLNYFYSKQGFTVSYYSKQQGSNIGKVDFDLKKDKKEGNNNGNGTRKNIDN